jgi:enterochelin esterase-like enzyme/alpha-beta hydrolase superfamily lysophospholipase
MSARLLRVFGILFVLCSLLAECPAIEAAEPLPGFKLDGERWTYEGDGLSMHGILLKPQGEGPFPGVLISHGLGGNSTGFGLNKARELVRWGFVCIACDYAHAASGGQRPGGPGADRSKYGASEENLKRASKCLDILASLPEVDPKRLCGYGHSMGGFVTIGLAAKEPERLKAAAISGSGVAPMTGFAAPPEADAAKIKTPFILFHGEADTTVRPAQSAALEEALKSAGVAVARHTYADVGHPVDQERAKEMYELMQQWFLQHGVLDKETPVAATSTPRQPLGAQRAPGGRPQQSGRPQQPGGSPQTAAPEWVRERIEAKNCQFRTFHSATIGGEVSYVIYVPAAYEQSPGTRLPVMYWLHGIGGAQTGIPALVSRFDEAIAAGKMPPLLIVFVNGVRDSFYCDAADGSTPVESVIIKDLIPHVDATFRTVATREGRIIEGFSMGGYGAAHLGFKYPELFGAVSIIDGALLDVGSMQSRHAALYQRIFAASEERFAAEHPRALAEKNADSLRGKTSIRFAVGALVAGNQSLHERLEQLDVPHQYEAFDLGHNHAAIYEALGDRNWEFYRQAMASKTE